ncbi:MAG: DUF4168 domain-containing protein [Chloroflexaceae bacterium]|nr:DUF4168 domain-containing protein [Chloroflexaceae bacterium]
MIAKSYFSSRWNQLFSRLLSCGAAATLGLALGTIPQFSQPKQLTWSYVASAQEFNQQQLRRYAEAVLMMETYRQQAFEDIKRAIGGMPPNIVCNRPESYRQLPANARQIANNYCNLSRRIVENSGLTVSQFNAITTRARSDNGLEKRIQNAMLEFQQDQRRANQQKSV